MNEKHYLIALFVKTLLSTFIEVPLKTNFHFVHKHDYRYYQRHSGMYHPPVDTKATHGRIVRSPGTRQGKKGNKQCRKAVLRKTSARLIMQNYSM